MSPNTEYHFSTVNSISDPAPLAFGFDAGFGATTLANQIEASIGVITDANGDFSVWGIANSFRTIGHRWIRNDPSLCTNRDFTKSQIGLANVQNEIPGAHAHLVAGKIPSR
jgi:hypothetical protein